MFKSQGVFLKMKKNENNIKFNNVTHNNKHYIFLSFLLISITPLNAVSASLLNDIDGFINGRYPVATASLTLYDPNGSYIDNQVMDATELLTSGWVNTGSEILFNGSLTFSNLYPFTSGGTGGALATVHDFSVDIHTAVNSPYTDLITLEIDWLAGATSSMSETWNLTIGDDFDNGIAYYMHGGYQPQPLNYGSANFSLSFATGIAPVPIPASALLFGSGLIGLIGIAKRKAPSIKFKQDAKSIAPLN